MSEHIVIETQDAVGVAYNNSTAEVVVPKEYLGIEKTSLGNCFAFVVGRGNGYKINVEEYERIKKILLAS
jgi:hypothetical protein